ncbi:hypothetical protein RF55_16638 [Lasius niger]|uniref:DUF8207 domain-containing protein n=1 Tax=Lasius niger TaxID=67767 RepID=A0A0J7K452_LASNI|nr:hypothetical protein RF55_16638 [Lasius niger]
MLYEKTAPSIEEIYETTPESLVTSVQHLLHTSEGQNSLRHHLGSLVQKYLATIMGQDKNAKMDYVYGVKFCDEGMMLGDKVFDVDKNDNIIINELKYVETPGLYKLILKKMSDDAVCTEDDLHKYKSILLTTNAHRRGNNMYNPVLGSKGYKYKFLIAPLISDHKVGKVINVPRAMTLSDNKFDYVH